MLPQMQDTLNMLRTSQNNKNLTAYEELNGKFDWNQTPIAPLGTRGMLLTTPTAAAHSLHIAMRHSLWEERGTTIASLNFTSQLPEDTAYLVPSASTPHTVKPLQFQSKIRQW